MLTRLWTTVKALRELNRTAPETLARARALQAQQDEVCATAVACFHLCPNLATLCDALLNHPLDELAQRVTLTPGAQRRASSL